jgi:hypothetical protein
MADNFMYTGSVPRPRRTHQEDLKAEVRADKSEARSKLLPAWDIVDAEIAAEKKRAYETLAKLPVTATTTEARVRDQLIAVQMHIEFLERFNNVMQNKLRVPSRKKDEDDD